MSAPPSAPDTRHAQHALPAELLVATMPFHVVVDDQMQILQLGRSMHRLIGRQAQGGRLNEHASLLRPQGPLDFANLTAHQNTLLLIQFPGDSITWRGEFKKISANTGILIGSLWLSDPDELECASLSVTDFAIHEPVVDMLQLIQALRVSVAELKHLNTRLTGQRSELRALNAQIQAQAAEARKLALVASRTDNAVIVATPRGEIEWVNDGFTRLTGYTLDDVSGRKPGTFLQCPQTDAATIATMRERLSRGEGFRCEILNQGKSGQRYWIAIEVQPIHGSQGELVNFMAIESDITARKLAERRTRLQYNIARLLAQSGPEQATEAAVLQTLAQAMGLHHGSLWFGSDQPLTAGPVWASNADAAPHPDHRALLRAAAREGRPVTQQLTTPEGLRISHATPLRAKRSLIGVCYVEGMLPLGDIVDDFAELGPVLESIGSQLGQFIERKREEARAQRLTRELNAIFELSPDGFVAFDHAANWVFANPAFFQMTGLSRDDMEHATLGTFDNLFARRLCDPKLTYRTVQSLLPQGQDTLQLVSPRPVVLSRSVRTLDDAQGVDLGTVVYVRDITHQSEVERMKSEFLSTAAHELRTPMASIQGFTELMLARDFDEPTRQDLLNTVHQQAKLLNGMVSELLDLARIEARGGKDFRIKPCDLISIVRNAVVETDFGDPPRRLQFTPPTDPVVVHADELRLRQAIQQILANAVRFSAPGSTVTLQIHCDASTPDEVKLDIQDQGIGMSPDQLERVFERFYRADRSGAMPGTGLGMCIAKEILDLLGARISLRSALGQGTTVSLWLRRA